MIDFKAGQNVKCTVTAVPSAAGREKTIERLMRLDPVNKKGLAKAYHKRQLGWQTKNRGNRDWVMRQTCGKIVRCEKGATWTMPFDFNIAADLKSCELYLKIEKA
ncbi:MAG TPA: hypothetical protein VEB22_03065 [Phycisphaerales bacterium]|nr:hypothetical protein [Phycisphaerales bacterium]